MKDSGLSYSYAVLEYIYTRMIALSSLPAVPLQVLLGLLIFFMLYNVVVVSWE